MIEDPKVFSRVVLHRSAIIFGLAALPLLCFREFRMVVGLFAGAALALTNFTLIRLPFEFMLKKNSRKGMLVAIAGFFARILIVAAGIYFLMHLHFVNIAGIFLGVTIPLVAISTFVVWKGSLKWKV
jgi:hypothetical protein